MRAPDDVEKAVAAERASWENAIFQAAKMANISYRGLGAGETLARMSYLLSEHRLLVQQYDDQQDPRSNE